jgi:hypothetical protein
MPSDEALQCLGQQLAKIFRLEELPFIEFQAIL